MHRTVLLLLLRSRLVSAPSLDVYLSSSVEKSSGSAAWVEFSVLFLRTAVLEKIVSPTGLPKLVDILKSIGDGRYKTSQQVFQNYRKPILRLLEELRDAAGSNSLQGVGSEATDKASLDKGRKPSHQESSSMSSVSLQNLACATRRASEDIATVSRNDPQGSKQQIAYLLENWVQLFNSAPGPERTLQFIQLLQHNGVGKSDEQTERFLRLSTELVVEAVLKSADAKDGVSEIQGLRYEIADAYTSLLSSMVRGIPSSAAEQQQRAQQISLLNKVLGVTVRCMMSNYERAKGNSGRWDQRPWFRLLLNLTIDVNSPSTGNNLNNFGALKVFGSAFHVVQPLVIPGKFALGSESLRKLF